MNEATPDVAETASVNRKDLIEGLGKGLRLIEAFDQDHPRLTPADAAALTGMSRTAARRFLLSLVHFGYAGTDGKTFWLQPRVLRLGQSYLETARLPRLVQPFLQRVSMQSGETADFSVLDGHEIVCLGGSSAPRVSSIGHQVGVRVPCHAVASGPVILSTWPERAIHPWISAHAFTGFTSHTVIQPEAFHEQVLKARRLGYWVSVEQLDVGLGGIAVPVRDRKGDCQGAIGMTVQAASALTEARVQELLVPLREAAQALRNVL